MHHTIVGSTSWGLILILFKACFLILKLVYGWKQSETRLNHEP